MQRPSRAVREWLRRRAGNARSDAGDTLVEILISLTVLSFASVAILLAFATSISGSGAHRQAVNFDTMLRTASAEATAAIQQLPAGAFSNCSAANTVNTASPSNFSLPSGYSASIQYVQYWNGSAWTGTQSPSQSAASGCTGLTTLQSGSGLQLLTIQVKVTSSGQTATTTTVASNPTAPSNTSSNCTGAKILQWVSQPANGQAGQTLSPVPEVVIEDAQTLAPCGTDASAVQLSIKPGTGAAGASLSNCSPVLGLGTTTFLNCAINTPGTGYQLTASDTTDGISTAQPSVPFNIVAGVAVQLVFATSPSNGTGGVAFPTQPTVDIEDSAGNTVTGDSTAVTLSIGTNPGNGTLSGCTSTTTNGVATFHGCNIDKVGTGYTLTATDAADNLTTASSPSNTFNITAGPAAQLAFTTSPGTTVTGDPLGPQPVVTVEDAGGNPTTVNMGTVSLGIGNNPGGGTLSGCSQTSSGGVVTFSGCSINQAGNGYTLVAKDGTLPQATSGAFNVATAALTSFSVTPSTTTPTAGTAFNVTIKALDQSGFTFPGFTGTQTMAFSGPSNSPNGTTPIYPATVSFSGGVGTASVTLVSAETTQLTASHGAVTGTSGTLTVGAKSTTASYSVANPGNQSAGNQFGLTINAVDQYGNITTGYNGSKTVAFSGPTNSPNGSAPSYPGHVTFSSGVGTASITLVDAQTTTLTATSGTITGTSGSFVVSDGGDAKFAVSNPGSQNAGTPFTVTINATDSYGNVAASFSGPQALTFSGPSSAPDGTAPLYPSSVTFSNGAGQASVTLYDAQTTTLTATASDGTTGTSSSFAVSGTGQLSSFVVNAPATATAGSSFSVGITAGDPYGNKVSSYTGSKAVVFSGPSNAPNGQAPSYPASVTFTAGAGTATVTLYDAQDATLTATQGTLTGSDTLTVSAATTSKFSVANPGTQTAGTAFPVTITAQDTYGNTATGYTGSKSVAFSGPANAPSGQAPTYPASVTFTNGQASPSITLYDVQSTTLTATQGSATGTTTAFSVTPGASSAFSLSNPATQTVGTPFTLTITAVDQWGNTTPGYAGSKAVGFSGPSNAPSGQAPSYPSTVSFTAGAGTASITLYAAESTSITATQGTLTDTTNTFTVNPGSARSFNVPTPSSQTAGTSFNEQLTALDQYGNTATGYTGSQTVSFSDPSTAPDGTGPTYPSHVTFTSGVGTASITLVDAESTTLTATQSSVTGTSGTFTVSAGSQASLYLTNITQQPTPAVACTGPVTNLTTCTSTGESSTAQTLTASLQLVDTYGNVTTNTSGSNITVNLSRSGSGATLTPSSGNLTIARNASTTSGQFSLGRASGTGRTATVTARISGTTELTATLSS
jgi:hypothetical protein